MDFTKILDDISNSNKPIEFKQKLFAATINIWQSSELAQGRDGTVIYKGTIYSLGTSQPNVSFKTIELIPLERIKFDGEISESLEFITDPNSRYWDFVLREFKEKNYPTESDIPSQGYDKVSVNMTFGKCVPENGYHDRIDVGLRDNNPYKNANWIFNDIISGAAYYLLKNLTFESGEWKRRRLTEADMQSTALYGNRGMLKSLLQRFIQITQWDWGVNGQATKKMLVDALEGQFNRSDFKMAFDHLPSFFESLNAETVLNQVLPFVATNEFIEYLNNAPFQKVYVDCPTWVNEEGDTEIRQFAEAKKNDWIDWYFPSGAQQRA